MREIAQTEGADINKLRRYAAALSRGTPEMAENLVAGAKALYAYYDKGGGKDDPPLELTPGDTEGVGILAGAQAFASNHRVMTWFHAINLESLARAGLMTKGDLDTLVDVVKCDSLEEDLRSIRNRHKLLFEAIIWAKLYGFDRSRGMAITTSATGLKGVEKELLAYWFQRFAKPIEDWSQAKPIGLAGFTGVAWRIEPIADGQYLKQRLQKRVSYMNRYLLAIGSSIPDDPRVFLART